MAQAFENPLLSHARMRQLYRGLVELRALNAVPRGLEACFVATAIGLDEDDFAGAAAAEYAQTLGGGASSRSLQLGEDVQCSALEQALCGVGAAMALRNLEGVAVAYLEPLRGADWTRLLTLAADLPLLLVALPGGRVDLQKAGQIAGGIPVIPVDASDAVALYRVAQEAMTRARADQQPAVIECVASGADPMEVLGEQLIAKKICTAAWLHGVEASFAKVLANQRAARKVH